MSSITNLPAAYLQSILGGTHSPSAPNPANMNALGASVTLQPDSQQLSPLAQMLGDLQKLQQSNPAQYQRVTQQIAANLQSAAQTAQSSGNSTAANQLNQLATDFTNASKSSQLPSIQDLAQAIGAHHHGHHHSQSASSSSSAAGPSDTDGDADGSGTSSSPAAASNQSLSQLLNMFQTNVTQAASTDPTSIIMAALSNAGIAS